MIWWNDLQLCRWDQFRGRPNEQRWAMRKSCVCFFWILHCKEVHEKTKNNKVPAFCASVSRAQAKATPSDVARTERCFDVFRLRPWVGCVLPFCIWPRPKAFGDLRGRENRWGQRWHKRTHFSANPSNIKIGRMSNVHLHRHINTPPYQQSRRYLKPAAFMILSCTSQYSSKMRKWRWRKTCHSNFWDAKDLHSNCAFVRGYQGKMETFRTPSKEFWSRKPEWSRMRSFDSTSWIQEFRRR